MSLIKYGYRTAFHHRIHQVLRIRKLNNRGVCTNHKTDEFVFMSFLSDLRLNKDVSVSILAPRNTTK